VTIALCVGPEILGISDVEFKVTIAPCGET